MKKITKIVSVLLAALMLIAVFASCSNQSEAVNTEAPVATTEILATEGESTVEDTTPKFAEADYGGIKFGVYFKDQNASHYRGMYIIPLENSSDVIDEAAVKRNLMIEDKYNIELVGMESDSPNTTVQKDLAAGASNYCLVLDSRRSLGNLATSGCFTNFNKLNVDFTTDWWDANAANDYEIDGKLYLMPNDVSVSNLAGCRFYYFNKEVLENFNLTSPYEYAEKNEWTVDTFITMVKSVSAPSLDGSVGIYGLVNEDGAVRNHMLTGVGVFTVERDSDGMIVSKFGTDYAERAQTFLDKIKAVFTDKNVCLTFEEADRMDAANSAAYSDTFKHARGLFANGHFLFTHSSMGTANEYAEAVKGVGVIMNPKFDSDQKSYYHMMDVSANIWGIPADSSLDLEMIGNVMDYWAYVSHTTVMESFYEITLKAKRASDPTAASMLDTIKGSIRYYITDLYAVDTSGMINNAYNNSVASAWKLIATPLQKNFQRVYDKLCKLDD